MSLAASRARGGSMSKTAGQEPTGDRAIMKNLDRLRANVSENLFHFRGNSKALVKSYNELRKAVEAERKFLSLNPIGKLFLQNMRIFFEGLDERIEEALALDSLCLDIQKGFQFLQTCQKAHNAGKENIANKNLAEAETIGDKIQAGEHNDRPESIQFFNKLNAVAADVIGRTPRTARDLNVRHVGDVHAAEDSPARRYLEDRDHKRREQHEELKVQTKQKRVQTRTGTSSPASKGIASRTPAKTVAKQEKKTSSSTSSPNPLRSKSSARPSPSSRKPKASPKASPASRKKAEPVKKAPAKKKAPPPPSDEYSSEYETDSGKGNNRGRKSSRKSPSRRSRSPSAQSSGSARSSRSRSPARPATTKSSKSAKSTGRSSKSGAKRRSRGPSQSGSRSRSRSASGSGSESRNAYTSEFESDESRS